MGGTYLTMFLLWCLGTASATRRYNPADPNMRRLPCGDHFHTWQYDGRAFIESFSVGVVVEGMLGAEGRWIPNGYDSRGRPRSEFSATGLDGGASAGVFARAITGIHVSFSLDAGWEYAYGEAAPYFRFGVGLPLDLSVDRTLPRLPE